MADAMIGREESESEDEVDDKPGAFATRKLYAEPTNVFSYAEPQSPEQTSRGQFQHAGYQYAPSAPAAQSHGYPYGTYADINHDMQRSQSYQAERSEPVNEQSREPQYKYTSQSAYAPMPHARAAMGMPEYNTSSSFHYAQMPETIKYTSTPQTRPGEAATEAQRAQQYQQYQQYYQHYQQHQEQQHKQQEQVEKKSKKSKKKDKDGSSRDRRYTNEYKEPVIDMPKSPRMSGRPQGSRHGSYTLAEPTDLSKKMHRLSVSGKRPDVQSYGAGHAPPASPLLEAYHGTYQSISPMPSPMMLPDGDVDDIPPLSPIKPRKKSARSGSGTSQDATRERKKIIGYDPTEDTEILVEALTRSRGVDNEAIIDILPCLSHDEIMELRKEYKKQCKVQGRGINLAKHVKLKVPGNFGKICYVTSLGQWESEAEWANFWYQSNSARRELLIEALMGRTNSEIRAIKDAFKDKRYGDSLSRCMDKELKADKFRVAVMMALEERRQEENDIWPVEYRNRDVDALCRAVQHKEGGESVILQIVISRSDAHLRDVLKTYERVHQVNFARIALKRSNNLVVST